MFIVYVFILILSLKLMRDDLVYESLGIPSCLIYVLAIMTLFRFHPHSFIVGVVLLFFMRVYSYFFLREIGAGDYIMFLVFASHTRLEILPFFFIISGALGVGTYYLRGRKDFFPFIPSLLIAFWLTTLFE